MRCKNHLDDRSSIVGVCASCLREKLLPLLDRPSPPLIFPRSVSPTFDRDPVPPNRIFFSTPQLAPGYIQQVGPRERSRFSLLPNLFRSRSEQVSTSTSRSWISGLFSGRKKKQSRMSSLDEPPTAGARRGFTGRGRGMSPARVSDCGADGELDWGGSSGCSSVRQTPLRAVPAARRSGRRGSGSQNAAAGVAFCLSPLVWPSPRRGWSQKAATPEVPIARLATAASLCANRSRKIADFGRFSRQ